MLTAAKFNLLCYFSDYFLPKLKITVHSHHAQHSFNRIIECVMLKSASCDDEHDTAKALLSVFPSKKAKEEKPQTQTTEHTEQRMR